MISERYESFWNEQRGAAALGLAEGKSQLEVAALVGVTDRTIRNWLDDDRFTAEIDRLSLMVGVASRAERLRLVNRLVKQRIREEDGYIVTEKDLLDWLKFAQSETDGAKIDLSKLAALLAGESDDDQRGPSSQSGVIDVAAGDGSGRLLSDGSAGDGEHGPGPGPSSPLATEDDALNPS